MNEAITAIQNMSFEKDEDKITEAAAYIMRDVIPKLSCENKNKIYTAADQSVCADIHRLHSRNEFRNNVNSYILSNSEKYSIIPFTDKDIDTIADMWAYEGKNNNDLGLWDNIETLVDDYIADHYSKVSL